MLNEFYFIIKWYGIEMVHIGEGYILCDNIETAKSIIKFSDSDEWGDWCLCDKDDSLPTQHYMKTGLYNGKLTELIFYRVKT